MIKEVCYSSIVSSPLRELYEVIFEGVSGKSVYFAWTKGNRLTDKKNRCYEQKCKFFVVENS